MNIRKEIDYSGMYAALDSLMAQNLPQMDLYSEIGSIVSGRAEKGAAVAAAEYLQAGYPEASGFSPRNLRRMREFYRTYENSPALLGEAMEIGWTQNVVILESGLTLEEMGWYIRAVRKYGWAKKQLMDAISAEEHFSSLDCLLFPCYTKENKPMENEAYDQNTFYLPRQHLPQPNGGVYHERPGEEGRAGEGISHRVRCHQPGGTGQPGLPAGQTQTGRAWDQLLRQDGPPAAEPRLREVRPAHWDGSPEPARYANDLRRGLCGQDAPPAGLYRPPWRCSRPVVHRRFRNNLAGRGGWMPGAA